MFSRARKLQTFPFIRYKDSVDERHGLCPYAVLEMHIETEASACFATEQVLDENNT